MAHLDAYLEPVPGYGWAGGPSFRTRITELKSGRERRNAEWARVRHRFDAPFENISRAAYQNIKQMHLVCRGMLHAFRFRDYLDSTATAEQFGTGTGSRTVYQLAKVSTFSGVSYSREVFALAAAPTVTIDGTLTTAFTVNLRTGVLTFTAAPANGAVLRWSGTFDVWVRFTDDYLPFSIDDRDASLEYRVNGSVGLIEVPPPLS